MRHTEAEMEIINAYETLRRESETLDCLDFMALTLAERNAAEYAAGFASEELGSLRGEYLSVLKGEGL